MFIKLQKLLYLLYRLQTGELVITYRVIKRFPEQTSKLDRHYQSNLQRIRRQWRKPTLRELLERPGAHDLHLFTKQHESLLRNTRSVLDVGCCTGEYSLLLKAFFPRVKYAGLETNQVLIGLAQKSFPKNIFVQGDITDLTSIHHPYDLVLASSVIHYLKEDLDKAIKNLFRITKKYLIISRTPVCKYQRDVLRVEQIVRNKYGTEKHYFLVFNRDVLIKKFTDHAFSLVAIDYGSEVLYLDNNKEPLIYNTLLFKKS